MLGRASVVLCVAVLLSGCGSDRTPDPVYVSEEDSGRAVSLSEGQDLVVTLTSNPSTGYGWSYQSSTSGVLSPVGETEYLPDEPVRIGSGGRERLRFTALRAGRTTLVFQYRQPWDTSSPAQETVSYDVVVQ